MAALPFDFSLALAYIGLFLVVLRLWARGRLGKSGRAMTQRQDERGFLFYSELIFEVFMLAAICAAVVAGFHFFFR